MGPRIEAHRALSAYLIASIVSLAGCASKTTGIAAGTPVTQVVTPDIYVAGFQDNSAGTEIAMLWKNSVPTALSSGAGNANSVAVSGTDVYVSGTEAGGQRGVAVLWKNGVPTQLTDGTFNPSVGQVVVSGTNVYVAGGQYGATADNPVYNVQGYWKNGVFTTLLTETPQGQNGGFISALAVQGSDVYAAGYEYKTTQTGPSSRVVEPVAMYWKNGQPVVLTDGLTFATATAITISGTDVYVAGQHCADNSPNCSHATYWKNGVETMLSSTTATVATGIAVSGNNVIVTGEQALPGSIVAEYWLNGTQQVLSQSPESSANGIATLGNDTYIVGSDLYGACFWKDTELPLGVVANFQYASSGFAIAVAQPQPKNPI